MKSFLRSLAIRTTVAVVPFALLYFYAEHVFRQSRMQEHHGDIGLGIFILGGMVCSVLAIGFATDLVVRLIYRHRVDAAIDAVFLLVLLTPVTWLFVMS